MKSCRIVTAPQNCGKTTYILRLISSSSRPKGFISIKDEKGYLLENIETGERRRYLSKEPEFPEIFKHWYIDSAVFDWVYSSLIDIESGEVFLDEVGMLELSGGGFAAIIKTLRDRDINLVIAVRDSFVESVIACFSLGNAKVVSVPLKSGK